MDELSNQEHAVELLQQLGLNEYESRSFVALARLPHGTAKEISEVSDVPRTRVYDAVRVLESKGLVEIQHSNPQQFRAVSVEEAAETLQDEYESRTESLEAVLDGIDPLSTEEETKTAHEVWSLTGSTAISNRTQQLIRDADSEVVLVIGDETVLTESIMQSLRRVSKQGVSVIVGTVSETLQEMIQSEIPNATVFVSGLDWIHGDQSRDQTVISRLLLIDRKSILVSTFYSTRTGEEIDEQAVFGHGFDNGFVTLVRRLLATGLLPVQDPKPSD
jgi:sugar-specific transcriptional regulator TrmB